MQCLTYPTLRHYHLAPHFPDYDLGILVSVVNSYIEIGDWALNPVLTEEGLDRLQDIMTETGN